MGQLDRQAKRAAWPAEDVRRLQILSARRVTSIFAGEYRSVFRGRGIEFEEVRDYQPGDDIRSIDWNVTARTGRTFVKQYVEEREMTVMMLLDLSPSLDCPSPCGPKSRVAAEISALLAFAAVRSNDRVGLLTFTDRIERYIPPGKGLRHAQRLIAEAVQESAEGQGTDLALALKYLGRVQRRGCILVVISDFLADDFQLPLAAAAQRHDVVVISLASPLDDQLPAVGLVEVSDAETGVRRLVDAGSPGVREVYRLQAVARQSELRRVFAAAGVEHLAIAADAAPAQALARFFLNRQRRLSR